VVFFYLQPTPNTKQSSWTTWQNKGHGLALPVSFSFHSPNHAFLFIPVHLPVISTNILLQHYNKLQKEITVTCCMVCKVNRNTIYEQLRSWLSWLFMYAVLTLTYNVKLHKPVRPSSYHITLHNTFPSHCNSNSRRCLTGLSPSTISLMAIVVITLQCGSIKSPVYTAELSKGI